MAMAQLACRSEESKEGDGGTEKWEESRWTKHSLRVCRTTARQEHRQWQETLERELM